MEVYQVRIVDSFLKSFPGKVTGFSESDMISILVNEPAAQLENYSLPTK